MVDPQEGRLGGANWPNCICVGFIRWGSWRGVLGLLAVRWLRSVHGPNFLWGSSRPTVAPKMGGDGGEPFLRGIYCPVTLSAMSRAIVTAGLSVGLVLHVRMSATILRAAAKPR